MSIRVSEASFQSEVLGAREPVLVEFYSDGCLGCKQISPVLGELEDEYEKEIKIVKVNALFSEELKNRYEVTVYPTILFFKKGQQIARLEGIVSQEELEAKIKEALED